MRYLAMLPVAGLFPALLSVAHLSDSQAQQPQNLQVKISPEKLIITPPQAQREKLAKVSPDQVTATVQRYDDKTLLPTMLGQWQVIDGNLTFTPRFPLTAGRYLVKTDFGTADIRMETADATPAQVTAIYPQSAKLPANTLRFYLHFDQAMKRGESLQHIRLLDEKNQPVDQAFLELEEELWTDDDRRLTVLLNPGRVKKALQPHEELGPVLLPNQKYRLQILDSFPGLQGKQKLNKSYQYEFEVTPAYETGLNPAAWKVHSPAARSKATLKLQFDRIMDHALRQRVISVVDSRSQIVPGIVLDTKDDFTWQFQPTGDWLPGSYTLVIQDVLEDICGNRIQAAFDSPLSGVATRQLKAPTVIPFSVR